MRLELVAAATCPRESAIYYEALSACYGRFGAAGAARGRVDGDHRVGLFFVLARQRQEVLGAVGIHLRLRAGTLPVERALGDYPGLAAKLDAQRSVAELSGLWVVPRLRRTGVSERLMQAATAALPILDVDVGVGFSHQHMLSLYARVGLFPDAELADIRYPDERYRSTVLWSDALGLTGVPASVRRRILTMRSAFEVGDKVRLPSERPPAPEGAGVTHGRSLSGHEADAAPL